MMAIALEQVKKVLRNVVTPGEPTVAFWLDSFGAREGEQIALTGPSGCGKSTLLNLISGILRADAGSIHVAGERLDQMSLASLDRFRGQNIGYIYQDFNLIDALNALDNVMLGLRFSHTLARSQWRARSREMLDRVGLGHRRHSKPARLSVGEKQRVAIARALVNHPPLILADEPTANLDAGTAGQIVRLLVEMCAEGTHTLLVVTHDPAVASHLSRSVDCSNLIRESDRKQ